MGPFLQRELWVQLNKDEVTPRTELFSMSPAAWNGVSFECQHHWPWIIFYLNGSMVAVSILERCSSPAPGHHFQQDRDAEWCVFKSWLWQDTQTVGTAVSRMIEKVPMGLQLDLKVPVVFEKRVAVIKYCFNYWLLHEIKYTMHLKQLEINMVSPSGIPAAT